MITFEYIRNNSGDAILKAYSYSGGILTIILTLTEPETDMDVELKIRTDHLSIDNKTLSKGSPHNNCIIEVVTLSEVLTAKNGFYVPADSFEKLMPETRNSYNLAYGKKVSDITTMLSLTGYSHLISCLVHHLENIEVREL